MKFGLRVPSIRKRIAARISWKRVVRHSLGVKAPRGWGWLTNPRRAAYNRIYNRTTVSIGKGCLLVAAMFAVLCTAGLTSQCSAAEERAHRASRSSSAPTQSGSFTISKAHRHGPLPLRRVWTSTGLARRIPTRQFLAVFSRVEPACQGSPRQCL